MTKLETLRGSLAGTANVDWEYLFGKISEGLEWQEQALCAQIDPEMWFPEDGGPKIAKKVCGDCLVKKECLNYAIDNDEKYGIWGGKTAEERELMRRKRNKERREEEKAA